MSLYVLVEGKRTEKEILRGWLPELLPGLTEVKEPQDVKPGTFFILASGGYPDYLTRIGAAIEDIRDNLTSFRHFLVCVDAEEETHEKRLTSLHTKIREYNCPVPFTVSVADCCIETWLLGHSSMCSRAPQSESLP